MLSPIRAIQIVIELHAIQNVIDYRDLNFGVICNGSANLAGFAGYSNTVVRNANRKLFSFRNYE